MLLGSVTSVGTTNEPDTCESCDNAAFQALGLPSGEYELVASVSEPLADCPPDAGASTRNERDRRSATFPLTHSVASSEIGVGIYDCPSRHECQDI